MDINKAGVSPSNIPWSGAAQVPSWRENYFEQLIVHDQSRAASLKTDALRKLHFLYRYRALSGYGLDELLSGRVHLTKPEQLNDPYESTLLLNHREGFTGASAYSALTLSEIIRDTRIAAFSETAESLLMWAHYANRPQGCCLEFAVEDLLKDEQLVSGLHPVVYGPTLWDANRVLHHPKEKLRSILLRAACHKLDSWSYEREWRLVDLRLRAPSHASTIPGLPPSFWDECYATGQSSPVGFDDQGERFVDLPRPRRVILLGKRPRPSLERLIHGLVRLSDTPLAFAELTPDAERGQELEIRDA